MMFGDIDCRLDEGIIRYHRGIGGDPRESIPKLVEDYVSYVVKVCSAEDIIPVICNVAMPIHEEVAVTPADRELLVLVHEEFNRMLFVVTSRREIPLLDLFTVSKNREIIAGQKCHIDTRHLVPAVYPYLIGKL